MIVNPTFPFNFTLQSVTVQSIGEMLENRREIEQAAEDDDDIQHKREWRKRSTSKKQKKEKKKT